MTRALTRRRAVAGLLAAGLAPARAQMDPHWPDRAVTLVHGVAPGSETDIIARTIADSLSRRLGQSVVVDPRPGSGGRIAAGQVARATPNGQTLLVMSSGYAVAAAIYKTLPYRPVDDFEMITLLTEFPLILVTSAKGEITSFADLVRLARSRAAPLLFGSTGNGSLQHVAGELLSRTLNITFRHVPYRGSLQAISDLVAGRIDFMVDTPTLELSVIRTGRVRPLMVTSAARYFALPDVPTAIELDIPSFSFTGWQGLAGPAGMAPTLVDRIATEITAVLSEPEFVERMQGIGNIANPSHPKDFRNRLIADIERWLSIVESSRMERI